MLKTLRFKPGINREGTSYSAEGGWYDCNAVRFRNGLPEKIGGWERISTFTFQGICRSLFSWVALNFTPYTGVGTHLKYYIMTGGEYYDITPIRETIGVSGAVFVTADGSTQVRVNCGGHGAGAGDFVTFSGASLVGGLDLNGEYQIDSIINLDSFYITSATPATSADSGGGNVDMAFQLNVGPAVQTPLGGWGAGSWGEGAWGSGASAINPLQIWNASNFGEDLVFGPRAGGVYYWDASVGVFSNRGVDIADLPGASDTPTVHGWLLVSDVFRFVILFGADSFAAPGVYNPMLIRWGDQESAANWTPSATSKAGEIQLSRGSKILTAVQTRQEIVVFTDVAVYSLQYVNAPAFWGAELLGDNISIAGPNSIAVVGTTVYWMGLDKFYIYDGAIRTLPCDVLRYVYNDINLDQNEQIFAGTVEGFSEVWWFYCPDGETSPTKYVVFNYLDGIWYYGEMERTAWLDTSIFTKPLAADPNNANLVYQEVGADNYSDGSQVAIEAHIESAQFDIDDGEFFGLVQRVMPDLTFTGSTAASPSGTITVKAMRGSGSGYTSPASAGGSSTGAVTRTATAPIEAYTNQVNLRVRGRQIVFRFESTAVGVMWQVGTPRFDITPSGRNG